MGAMKRPSPKTWPLFLLVAAAPGAYGVSTPAQLSLEHDLANHQALLLLPAALLIYYFVVWLAVGRDRKPETIVPRYQPPVNLSPAAVRYVVNAGTDHKSVAAVLLEL